MSKIVKHTLRAVTALLFLIIGLLVLDSCIKFPKIPKPDPFEETTYTYPFKDEISSISFELTIKTNSNIAEELVDAQIPFLKYNKSWLFTLVQDDCMQGAYSATWAAINGYPLSSKYYYDFKHFLVGDLPPDHYYLGKTLGSTDGAGNEVRFSFATTLAPEEKWMDAKTSISKGMTSNFARFYIKNGLVWDNVREIVNSGNAIAFHNVSTDQKNADSIALHFRKSQDIIIKRLNGRGAKMLAEPDGNKTYITAGLMFPEIKVMTAQAGAKRFIPFTDEPNLDKLLIERRFYQNQGEYLIMDDIVKNLKLPIDKRYAINVGVHAVYIEWLTNIIWINDTYGKDGDDSVWFTSLDEYYEYNYYRHNSSITKRSEGDKLIISVKIPMEQYFYFPSLTLNIKGLKMSDVASITTSDQVKGLSFADFKEPNGETFLMVNVDCRKYLTEHATHFVERYENRISIPFKNDALYFVNKLKNSDTKNALLQRLISK